MKSVPKNIFDRFTSPANLAFDQLVTNMVNMEVHQKHSENLVHWSKLELIWAIG